MELERSVGPLSGVRVLDFGLSWAGPFAGMILADLGADVIKVESARKVDILRWSGAFSDGERNVERGGWYNSTNRNKRGLALDLKHPAAREIIFDLIKDTDVLIENFAPRVMPSLGMSFAELSAINPKLVMVSLSGYGASGPQANHVSYGDHLMYASGMTSQVGEPDDPPTMLGTFYGDPVGGMLGATALLAALADRDCTGRGRWLDISQLEGLTAMLSEHFLISNESYLAKSGDFRVILRSQGEDAWIAVEVQDEHALHELSDVFAESGDAVQESDLAAKSMLEQWARRTPQWEAVRTLQQHGIAAYPVVDAPSMLRSPQLHARNFFHWVDRAISGPDIVPGATFRISGDPSAPWQPAPLLGEHSREILTQDLARSSQHFDDLVADGAIG